MAGKFELYKDKKGEFRFRLKAANGQNILSSEGYKTRASATNGIESVQKNSQIPERFETHKSEAGKFTFSLKASNGQVIGTSQVYQAASGCSDGIESVANSARGAEVVDLTDD